MSQPQYGRNDGRSPAMAGSVRRAREMAEASMARGNPDVPSTRRAQVPPGLQLRDEQGQIGMAISRPTPLPQWPLPGPVSLPSPSDSEPYRPPPGRSQPPQRPPRPSKVPSILDGSRIQEHTPIFQYTPRNARASEMSAPETIQSESSRLSTVSSVGTIPDFPLPVAAVSLPPSRRSANLGPPPSSRRGASSFYSTISYVSPIPEESPRTRSRTSYASSAAIPQSFESLSPGYSPTYSPVAPSINDTIAEESFISDDADESSLVRSASIGKRGKPSLVTTGSFEKRESMPRPGPTPLQGGPFRDGTGYIEGSSSSSANISGESVGAAVTANNMLNAFEGASATDPSSVRNAVPSPRPYNRLSAIRRPPRLDIDAVRAAEARGSLTSLPDLIRRATRLASLMDRGRRPASRFDDLDFPEDIYGSDPEKDLYNNKHQSGLSDMLAAFPPPASRSGVRKSRLSTAWPLGRTSFRGPPPPALEQGTDSELEPQKKGRRFYCGLPIWTCFALVIILLCIIAAAVIVPVKFLVLDKAAEKTTAQPAISDCEAQLNCANGGTNVIVQGVCSCICSNGFTGVDCTVPTSQGCTTTSISMGGSDINNVTIGQAIPRLIRDAESNFSVPLVATLIQSKFNKESLSCNTENSLVTFNGQSFRTQGAKAEVADFSSSPDLAQAAVAADGVITLSVLPDVDITLTVENPAGTGAFSGSFSVTTLTGPNTISGSTLFATTITPSSTKRSSPTPYPTIATTTITTPTTSPATAISSSTKSAPMPSSTFVVTEEVIDFARVAVLYIFQEKTLPDAITAQSSVQSFFTDVDASRNTPSSVMVEQGLNVTVGGGSTIDFVNLSVDIGKGRVGGRKT
ncbi:uncharacterized protein F4812DRAFT_82973 [Daldinia caldariorum]|uniref:uncharacterized protein n=1 Tax=Daldinia caldariorum TaxID=326644 RepID=UPI002007575B|nr:uncharacterized protein F4812DRAFT_82973 [Daldinia caldariorum]KAI1466547.1 hypothetical protein F4812DRAFT_82973 [Daldinia caldariorum]